VKIVPHLLGGQYAYSGLYDQYGHSPAAMLVAPFRDPLLFIHQLFGKERLKFLLWTLAPVGFLPLFGGAALFAALPGYLMLFLSGGGHRVNLGYHYGIEPGVGLFWASATALPWLAAWASRGVSRKRQARLAALVCFLALATFGRSEVARIRRDFPDEHARWLSAAVLPCVDPGVSLAASEALVPHLAMRPWASPLDLIHTENGLGGPSGEGVSCVIRDLSGSIGNVPMTAEDFASLEKELVQGGYHSVYSCRKLEVFSRETVTGVHCLRCDPGCV
jgi:hypothetical protein